MEPDNAARAWWLIGQRHSSRAPFDPTLRVTERELEHIIDAARWAPTAHNMQNFRLIVVDDREVLNELGAIHAPVSPTFIAENYRQLSWTHEELDRRRIGLLGSESSHDTSRMLRETLAGAPMVIVAVYDPTVRAPASEGDVLGMISLGCVLENMWLAATAAHLDAQVVSAFADENTAPQVTRVLAIAKPWRIGFALRVGHATVRAPEQRVRRLEADFVARNRFK
jgi:nitroreductase